MRALILVVTLAVTALIVACDEDLLPTEGALAITIVRAEPTVVTGVNPRVAAPEVAPLEQPRLAVAAFTAVRVTVTPEAGGSARSANLTLEGDFWVGSVTGLPVGNYTVRVEAFQDGDLAEVGERTGVQVRGGQTTETQVSTTDVRPALSAITAPGRRLSFGVSYTAVAGAASYRIEWSQNADFTGIRSRTTDSTSATVTVDNVGEWFVRVRAVIGTQTTAPSNTQSVTVQGDDPGTGVTDDPDAAVSLGSTTFSTTVAGLNIAPAGDQDWFAVRACREDVLDVSVQAQSIASSLNARLAVQDSTSKTVLATAEGGGGTDPALQVTIPDDDKYEILVAGVGSSTGHYEVTIGLTAGPNNSAGTCTVPTPDSVAIAQSDTTLQALGDQMQLTATVFDANGDPITDATITWSTDAPGVANVDPATGLVTAIDNGTAVISATGQTATAAAGAERAVAPDSAADAPAAHGPELERPTRGRPASRAAPNLPSAGRPATQGKQAVPTASITITVQQVATSVVVNPPGITLTVGGAVAGMTAEARDANGNLIVAPAATWESLNPNVATVAAGDVTAVASGQATVGAQVDGVTGYALATVTDPGLGSINAVQELADASANNIARVFGFGPAEAYAAVFGGEVLRWDGSTWTVFTDLTDQSVNDLWGTSPADLYVTGFGDGNVYRYDGTAWTPVHNVPGQEWLGVWGASPSDVFVVGGTAADGRVLHFDGSSWTEMTVPAGDQLLDVWGTARNDVFAVGVSGRILHFDGTDWTPQSSPVTTDLRAVWGTAANDVFAVGSAGVALRYNGTDWVEIPSGVGSQLRDVGGTSSGDVYAVGVNGVIRRFDGAAWSQVAEGGSFLRGVWTMSGGPALLVGDTGRVALGHRGASVTASPATTFLSAVGDTVRVTATVQDAAAVLLPGVPITFTSLNAGVASVDAATGLVTAQAIGAADIVATAAGGAADTVTVTIAAGNLAFRTVPTNVPVRTAFTVEVEVQDETGAVITSDASSITLALATNAGEMVYHASGLSAPVLELVDPVTPAVLPPLPNVQPDEVLSLVYSPGEDVVLGAMLSGSFAAFDPVTGTQAVRGNTGQLLKGLAFVPDGRLLGVSRDNPNLYGVDPATGAPTSLGAVGGPAIDGFTGLATDPTTGTLYGAAKLTAAAGGRDRELVTIDPATLNATAIGTFSEDGVAGITFLADGILLAVTGDGASLPERLWTVDKTTAAMTIRVGLSNGDDGEAIAAVPARMTGTLTVAAVNGVATFSDLAINAPAAGYVLEATGPDLAPGLSDPFTVDPGVFVPGPPQQLAFRTVPAATDPRAPFTVEVEIQDALGFVVPGATNDVTVGFGANPGNMLFRASTEFPIELNLVDPATPADLLPFATIEPSTGDELTALVYDPAGDVVLAADRLNHNLYTIDRVTGARITLGLIGDRLKGLAFEGVGGTGRLLGLAQPTNTVYDIDPATGAASALGAVTGITAVGFNGLATDPTTGQMYAVARESGGTAPRNLILLDPGTLAGTFIGALPEDGVAAIAFLQDGTLLALTGDGASQPRTVYTVDKATAAMTMLIPLSTGTNCCGAAMTRVPARLSGTLTLAAGDGVAAFTDLEIDAPASGYTLIATGPGLTPAESGPFTVNPGQYTPGPPATVVVTPDAATLLRGETVQLTAEVFDALGVLIPGATVIWFSSNVSVATVDASGLVTAQGPGFATITAEATNGVTGTAQIQGDVAAAYLRSTVGAPWGAATNEDAMDQAFGAGNWDDLRYETVDVPTLFTHYRFIFLEGGDSNADELEAFIAANLAAWENYVTAGGRALINAGPNEGDGMSFGFGVSLIYPDFASSVEAVDVSHPIFVATVTTAFTGGSFSHGSVTGAGLLPIIQEFANPAKVVLAEMAVGGGLVLFGGMTTDNFHSPQPDAHDLRINILRYTAGQALGAAPPALTPAASQDGSTGDRPNSRRSLER